LEEGEIVVPGAPVKIPEEVVPLVPTFPGPAETPAESSAEPLISPKKKVELPDFHFRIQGDLGLIEVSPEQLGEIRVTKGTPLVISIPAKYFAKKVKVITLTIRSDSQSFLFKLNEETDTFEVAVNAPLQKGEHSLIVTVIYEDGSIDTISTNMTVDPYGYIYERRRVSGEMREIRIPGAIVTLFWFNPTANAWEKWDGESFNQKNPQITQETGEYVFMVPQGIYYIQVEKDGYYLKKTEAFETEEIVSKNIMLEPLSISEQWFWWACLLLIGLISGLYFFIKKRLRALTREER